MLNTPLCRGDRLAFPSERGQHEPPMLAMLKLAAVGYLILLAGLATGCQSDGAGPTTQDESDEHRTAPATSLTPVPRSTTTPLASRTVTPANAAIGGILKLQVSATGLRDTMISIQSSELLYRDDMIDLSRYCRARFIEIRDERLWPERYRELLDELKAVCESLPAFDGAYNAAPGIVDAAGIKAAVNGLAPQFTALVEAFAADTYAGIVAEVEARTSP